MLIASAVLLVALAGVVACTSSQVSGNGGASSLAASDIAGSGSAAVTGSQASTTGSSSSAASAGSSAAASNASANASGSAASTASGQSAASSGASASTGSAASGTASNGNGAAGQPSNASNGGNGNAGNSGANNGNAGNSGASSNAGNTGTQTDNGNASSGNAGNGGSQTQNGGAVETKPTSQTRPETYDQTYRDVLVVGMDPERAPYVVSAGDGTYYGLDVELAQAVCEANGWALEIVPISWQQRDVALTSGQVDCLWGGLWGGLQVASVYTAPYLAVDQGIYVRSSDGKSSYDDLAGAVVSAEVGSAAYSLLEDESAAGWLGDTFAGGLPQPEYDVTQMFGMLADNATDAVACDVAYGSHMVGSSNGAFSALPGSFGQGQLYVAFRAGDEELAATVTQALGQLYQSGIAGSILADYAGYGISASNWLI